MERSFLDHLYSPKILLKIPDNLSIIFKYHTFGKCKLPHVHIQESYTFENKYTEPCIFENKQRRIFKRIPE